MVLEKIGSPPYNGPMDPGRPRKLAERFFSSLAARFPVMCASDEFHFFPRAESAQDHYDLIDDLGEESIGRLVDEAGTLRSELDTLAEQLRSAEGRHPPNIDYSALMEARTDIELLRSCASAIIIEFEDNRSWLRNPLLYLKIAFIGLDHALGKPASSRAERVERTCSRLRQIPRLLEQAKRNIGTVPEPYHQSALAMTNDCTLYLHELLSNHRRDEQLVSALIPLFDHLNRFRSFLESCPLQVEPAARSSILEKTLRHVFRYEGSLAAMQQMGLMEWNRNLEYLERIAAGIGEGASWLEMYDSSHSADITGRDTLTLYREENDRLESFFRDRGLLGFADGSRVLIVETPLYLRSVRGTASFSAAFSVHPEEESLFYITTELFDEASGEETRQRLHREFRFLTAHETFPGHHLLDRVRRGLKNPIRRQIESPLFYEGWAAYSEKLLLEHGYLHDTLEELVLHKRNLWRAARCLVDVGLTTGMFERDAAVELIVQSGFSRAEAQAQIKRFILSPGYQLCYTLGSLEILKLRERYGTLLSSDRFHALLLGSGQLPFHLIDEHLRVNTEGGPGSA
jgi:hypothetical protein